MNNYRVCCGKDMDRAAWLSIPVMERDLAKMVTTMVDMVETAGRYTKKPLGGEALQNSRFMQSAGRTGRRRPGVKSSTMTSTYDGSHQKPS